jgi:histidine triad (HIT) family protein
MSYEPNNIFAKIIRGDAPAYRVFEDDATVAFMDIMPQADGHTLVVPKASAQDLFDIDPQVLARTIVTTQRVARAVKVAFAADGIMIAQLSGAAAGQTVFHLHFHILPRRSGVDFRLHAREPAPAERLNAHAVLVRNALAQLGDAPHWPASPTESSR